MAGRALVLDANVLIRAVLGNRVRRIIEEHAERVSYFVPESACVEAEEPLAALVTKRGGDPAKALAFLQTLLQLVDLTGVDVYGDFEKEAGRGWARGTPTIGRF